ncbi:ankyrin and armadillo repeat-containing protein isoform X2 [Lissotriton helveticus]
MLDNDTSSADNSQSKDELKDAAYVSKMAAQRNANVFFEKFSRSELQELLAVTSSSWLVTKDYTRTPDSSSGLTAQLKDISSHDIVVLMPVAPDAPLDCKEVHQILRELTVGIFCFNQIPSINLEANYDRSTFCQLSPAYYDTRVGQILINVDYTMKTLWHGAYMPREKRIRFSEIWRTSMDIDANGKPQTKRNIFEEFSSAGLVDISKEADFEGVFEKNMNEDPTYQPNSPGEVNMFMDFAEKMSIKMTCYTTRVQQFDNLFTFAGSYTISNIVRPTEEQIDSVTYQRLQQRQRLHQKTVTEYIEKKAEIRKHIEYIKLISFLAPLLVALKKKAKIPALDRLLQPLSDDKVKTERELPPLMLGPEFTCQHFQYSENEYFHLHGGIEIDIGTPSLEDVSDEIKAAYDGILTKGTDHNKQLLDLETSYREHYPMPIMEFNGTSYYVISFETETFYRSSQKVPWREAINEMITELKPKRLPLNDAQLHEQFKKRFGYKKAIKCKSLNYGLRAAAEKGLSAIFHTCCRKVPAANLGFADESGYALIHRAALHNHTPIIVQLARAGLNLNQRRIYHSTDHGKRSAEDKSKPMDMLSGTRSAEDKSKSIVVLSGKRSAEDRSKSMEILGKRSAEDNANSKEILGNLSAEDNTHSKEILGKHSSLENEISDEKLGNSFSQDSDDMWLERLGPTALHLAAQCGSLEALYCLLTLKADVTITDKRGWAAIHFAAFYGNIPAIRVLLRREPALLEMETEAEYRTTPLLLAATSGSLDTFCFLLSVGASWEKVDSLDNNIVHLATLYFHTNVLNYIIDLNVPEFPVWDILAEMLNSKESTRKEMAVRCLEVFCVSKEDYWVNIVNAGMVPRLVEMLRSKQVTLESVALGLLSNISKQAPVARALENAGGIPLLIHLLNSPVPLLQSRSAVILSDAAQVDNNQNTIRELGGFAPLVGLLHSDLEDVLVNAMNCMKALSKGNPLNQKAIEEEGAIPILVEFLSSKTEDLMCASAKALAELARGNKEIQDAIARQDVINPLIKMVSGRNINIQVKGAMTIEALADHNAAIQKMLLEQEVAAHVSKLLKVFQLEVREQGATTLWAMAGQLLRQQKLMAEHITYNYILDLLLAPSDKMQYVGGQAMIALSKDSRRQQNQICEGNGVGPLVRLLRSYKISDSTLLSVIRALGTMCIGVAHQHNPVSQTQITEEQAMTALVHLLRTHPSLQIKVEVACTLACIVLRNTSLQNCLQGKEGFKYSDVLELLHAPDKDIRLRAGYALALFAFSNTLQQFLLSETGGVSMSIFEPFLNSPVETDRATAAFQIIVLARVIADVDQVTLTAKGVTILVKLLRSEERDTIILAGELISSLSHTRAGIPDAFTTLGTIESLTRRLYSEDEEVRVACANALGYLSFNRTAHRYLLIECRRKPELFDLLRSNLSEDARISTEFTKDFERQKQVGLPSISLDTNGGLVAVPVVKKGGDEYTDGQQCEAEMRSKGILRSKSAVVYSTRKHMTGHSSNRLGAVVSFLPPTSSIKEYGRPKTAHIGNTGLFQQK